MPSKSLRDRLPEAREHGPKSKIQNLIEAVPPKIAEELIELLNDNTIQSSQLATLVNDIAQNDLGWDKFFIGGHNLSRVRRERRYWSPT